MIPNNIIALSRESCNCHVEGASPEWDSVPIFDMAITDDIDLTRFNTDSCRTVWSAMNDVRSASISKFINDFGAGLRDYAVRKYENCGGRVGYMRSNWIETRYTGCVLRPNRAQFHNLKIKTVSVQTNKACNLILRVFDNLQNEIAVRNLNVTQGYSAQRFEVNIELPCYDSDNTDLAYFFIIESATDAKICDTNAFCCGRSHNFNTHRFGGHENGILNYAAFGSLVGESLSIENVKSGTGGLCLEVECSANYLDLLKSDAVSYGLSAECIQLAAVSKAYEKCVNSPEINRFVMLDRETAVQSIAIFGNRYKAKLAQLLENLPIPKKSAWVKRGFGNMKIDNR